MDNLSGMKCPKISRLMTSEQSDLVRNFGTIVPDNSIKRRLIQGSQIDSVYAPSVAKGTCLQNII
jgi:hypothetical protein